MRAALPVVSIFLIMATKPRPAFLLSLLLLVPFLAVPARAQEQTLYWQSITVNALLDAAGTLHVRERQEYVFNGPWNGGEREFRVGLRQELELEGIFRVGPDGREIPLVEGDLDQVDHYEWANSKTLRWRSRLPGDPPFEQTPITYVLAYRLSKILDRDGEVYKLSHEFGLPAAQWPIRLLTVELRLDKAWTPLDPVEPRIERRDLDPGSNVIVRARLKHEGAAPVDSGVTTVSDNLRLALFGATLLAMLVLYVLFRRHQGSLGRFEPLPEPPGGWNEGWLRENVFDLKPEQVGALWDNAIGPPEVAAVLARLVAEGKMTSTVTPPTKMLGFTVKSSVLALTLTTDRDAFVGYERTLVDKLFVAGDHTDTDMIRKHYRSSGFNPATSIKDELLASLTKHGDLGTRPAPSRRPTQLLWLAVLALFGLEAIPSAAPAVIFLAITMFVLIWPLIFGNIAAYAWRKRLERLDLMSLTFLIPGLLGWLACLVLAFARDGAEGMGSLAPGLFGTLALAVAPLAVWNNLLNNARTRESDSTLQKRRLLAAARKLLRQELKSPQPRLQDEWLPYLLAFGLGSQVDDWFRSFGGLSHGTSMMTTSHGMGSSGGGFSGSGSSGWSGGGGQFGGAGATGAWAVAATGMASGVAAPSSSSSGGGGGGSSSGGGGGGGW